MRVRGNYYPESIIVEQYRPIPGMVEVRLRDNVIMLSDTLYEYDEYTKVIRGNPDLKDAISENLPDWLKTLRSLEVKENASILVDLRSENDTLLNDIAQMIDEVYASDIEMMGL